MLKNPFPIKIWINLLSSKQCINTCTKLTSCEIQVKLYLREFHMVFQ